jgi:proliferating cell nuclear antigen
MDTEETAEVDENEEEQTTEDDTIDATDSTMSNDDTSGEQTAIINAGTLQTVIDSVDALVDETKMHFNENGLDIRAVDPANVGMVDQTLDAAAFELYNGGGELIALNLSRLDDIASMASSDDLIELTLEMELGRLNIQFNGLTYNLALIDPDSVRQEPDIPDLDLPAEIIAETNTLDRGIKAADMVSDHIELAFDSDEDQFIISAEGDTDDVDLSINGDDLIDYTSGDAASLFSLDYLEDMNKAIPSDVAITMELGEEFPVKLHYEYAEGLGHVTYMLAPRIQSD